MQSKMPKDDSQQPIVKTLKIISISWLLLVLEELLAIVARRQFNISYYLTRITGVQEMTV